MFPTRILRIVADESGPTAVEYALMLAFIILAAIAGIQTLGGASQAFWQGNMDALSASVFTTE